MQKIITRLSFSTIGWQEPSGPLGKSKNQIHEHVYGFGFEEWLFNTRFLSTKMGIISVILRGFTEITNKVIVTIHWNYLL